MIFSRFLSRTTIAQPVSLSVRVINRVWYSWRPTAKNKPAPPPKQIGPRKNERITAPSIMLIDESGGKRVEVTNVFLSKLDRTLYDLVEVNPKHNPPICKLMSRATMQMKQKLQDENELRQRLKNREKEIRFGTSMAEHDYSLRMDKVCELLEKDYRLRIVVPPKGVLKRDPFAKEHIWKRIFDELTEKYGKHLKLVSAPQVLFKVLTAIVALDATKVKPTTEGRKAEQ